MAGTNEIVGLVGVVHPGIQTKSGLNQPAVLFEILLSAVQAANIPKFQEISRYPAIRRDLAIIVDQSVPAQALVDLARQTAGELLINLELFDEYRGEGIDSGRKSLALGLTLQHSSRTLKEDEIEAVVSRVISTLGSDLGAQLRQ